MFFLLGHINNGLVDGFGSSLFADALYIIGDISDISDIHIDKIKPNLVELRRNIFTNLFQKFLPVLINLFNG